MRCFALALALLWTGLALAQAPRYPLTVKGTREGRGAMVRAHNEGPIPVSVVVSFTEFKNLQSTERVPIVMVVPPNSTLDLTRLNALDPKQGWGYRLRYRFRFGSYNAGHDPAALYRVPWMEGRTFIIGQAPGGRMVTHLSAASREAVDIPMPEGTPILAARAGIVFMTVAENDQHRPVERAAPALRGDARGARGRRACRGVGAVPLLHRQPAARVQAAIRSGGALGLLAPGNRPADSSPAASFRCTRSERTRCTTTLNVV
jgi:hypothetical protein